MSYVYIEWEGEFSASHFLLAEHWGKCRRLHGHNWKVKVKIGYDMSKGYINYTEIKRVVNGLDHRLLVSKEVELMRDNGRVRIEENRMVIEMPEDWLVIIPYDEVTSENVAKYLAEMIKAKWKDMIYYVVVEVWEDERSMAEVVVYPEEERSNMVHTQSYQVRW